MKSKVLVISKVLNKFFPTVSFPLYYINPFTLLISVMLSANTTDLQANIAAKKLYSLADNAKEMSKLSLEEIENAIFCCGLYRTKAKNILNTASIITNKYKGKIPKSRKALMSLPGVGRKTANIILSELFDIDTFPVDTHIFRLAKRWKITAGKSILQAEEDLKKNFSKNTWRKRHLQMIYFGRKFCTAKRHKVENCPMCSSLMKESVLV